MKKNQQKIGKKERKKNLEKIYINISLALLFCCYICLSIIMLDFRKKRAKKFFWIVNFLFFSHLHFKREELGTWKNFTLMWIVKEEKKNVLKVYIFILSFLISFSFEVKNKVTFHHVITLFFFWKTIYSSNFSSI